MHKIYFFKNVGKHGALKFVTTATEEQIIELLKKDSGEYYWHDTDAPLTFQNINNVISLTAVNERWD